MVGAGLLRGIVKIPKSFPRTSSILTAVFAFLVLSLGIYAIFAACFMRDEFKATIVNPPELIVIGSLVTLCGGTLLGLVIHVGRNTEWFHNPQYIEDKRVIYFLARWLGTAILLFLVFFEVLIPVWIFLLLGYMSDSDK